MNLLVHELTDELIQVITASENQFIGAIRPHIYKHNAPSGTIKIEVRDTNGKVISTSNSLQASDITAIAFFHGYVKFDINVSLKADTNYQIALVSGGGYSFSESAYFGWCNDYDLRKVTADYSPSVGYNAALDLELWEKKLVVRESR